MDAQGTGNGADVAALEATQKRRGRPPKNATQAPTVAQGSTVVDELALAAEAQQQVQHEALNGSTAGPSTDQLVMQQQQQQQYPEHQQACLNQQQQHRQQQDGQQQQPQQQQDLPVKRRGRPLGSKNKTTLAKEGTAGPLMTMVLYVQPGEDVTSKLQELAAARSCSLTVLAASGALSAATLAQCSEENAGGMSAGIALTGIFTILSISGSILQPSMLPPAALQASSQQQLSASSADAPRQHLSASLAGPSGGVVGGVVAGPLIAAEPVLLVLGLFGQ